MRTFAMGIDFGSTTAKTVIVNQDGQILGAAVSHMGAVSDEGVKDSVARALAQAGVMQVEISRTVSTGYGRRMLDYADKTFTEITCHARGAIAMVPDARMVIDIGGQDSKVIAIDANGLVSQFAMNDRCAAGTGKFLEVLARAMQIELPEMGGIAMQARNSLKISSMCATFAETEVISLLAEGQSKPDVLGAVHAAIAARTLGLVARVGKRGPIVMTGGVAKNVAAVHHIQDIVGMTLTIPADPQIAGALGAALLALDDVRAARKAAACDEDDRLDGAMGAARICTPACKGTPSAEPAVASPVPRRAVSLPSPAFGRLERQPAK